MMNRFKNNFDKVIVFVMLLTAFTFIQIGGLTQTDM